MDDYLITLIQRAADNFIEIGSYIFLFLRKNPALQYLSILYYF